MALLQISEPNQSFICAKPSPVCAVGIDLGTTHSLVSVLENGKPITLPDEGGDHLLPSCVHFSQSGVVTVGVAAVAFAAIDSLNTIFSVKRLMGRGVASLETLASQLPYDIKEDPHTQVPYISTVSGLVTPVEVSAHILRALKVRAEAYLKDKVSQAVITVPAYFDDAQRQATKDAAKLAGLNVLRLINEPTAAALAYGLDAAAEGVFAVYDLGGGTFDISILRMRGGVFEVLATAGDTALGGDDIDRLIVSFWLKQVGIEKLCDAASVRILLQQARAVKERLSHELMVDVCFTLEGHHYQLMFSREALEKLILPFVQKTIKISSQALRSANLMLVDLSQVIMVGGSTRIPFIQEKLKAWFGRALLTSVDPDKVVALGAGTQAANLAGKGRNEWLLIDVLPLSLGLETMGGLVEKVISRNTSIPVAKSKEFTTFKNGQTAMSIHVVQGERELVKDCRSLAQFNLTGIPPMLAGVAKVKLTFQVDADGLLCVTAQEMTTGVIGYVEVKPSYGLTEQQVADMIASSFQQAKEDVSIRGLAEAHVEALRVIEAVTAALTQDGDRYLSSDSLAGITQAIQDLHHVLDLKDKEKIIAFTKVLNRETEHFAALRMSGDVSEVLKGHKVSDFLPGCD